MTSTSLVRPGDRLRAPELDGDQQAAVERAVDGPGSVVVVGPPGSGKSTVVCAVAAQAAARGVRPERLLVLAPTRDAAARLRDTVASGVGRASGVAVVHTAASVAHAVLTARAEALGEPPPSLVTGADQDAILRDLLEGHRRGAGAATDWSPVVPEEATLLPGFRAELRDLIMRATEAGLEPDGLRSLGERTGRVEWILAAEVYAEYRDVIMWPGLEGRGLRYDPASAAREAAVALDGWERAWGERPTWDLVVVDDYQDATAATIALLESLTAAGARLVLVGNADESVQGYRGGVPSALGQAAAAEGRHAFGAAVMRLSTVHRQREGLARVVDQVVERIGTQSIGSARRAAADADGDDPADVEILVAPHRYAQSRAIAAALRRARHGAGDAAPVSWDRMAVIARSNLQLRALRADLLSADIPCESLGDGVALHEQAVVAPLLGLMLVAAGAEQWNPELAVEVLSSRLVGLDPVGLRRLRRALVKEDRAGGGNGSADALLVDALEDPSRWSSLGGEEARLAARASAAVAAAREVIAAGEGSPRRVIWSLWNAFGVAEAWRAAALAGSPRDDADLDAVIALLREAQNVEERRQLSVQGFVTHLASQEFAVDSLGARAQGTEAVSFATPASAAGREWDLVVVAGVEEGVWPNVRLRDSVLGAQHLAEIVAFRASAEPLDLEARSRLAATSRRTVLDDESRAFAVAVSRATSRVVVSCVEDEDTRPSRFVDWVQRAAGVERSATGTVPRMSDLRHAVATLRAEGARASALPGDGHAEALARLAALEVPGADPTSWHGVAEPSTSAGFFDATELVRVSPSRVEGVERCGLRWALESAGGVGVDSDKQQLGTLIHELAQSLPAGTEDELRAELDERWHEIAGEATLPYRTLRSKADAMVRRLAEYFAANPPDRVGLEQRFEVGIEDAVLTGSADRVETRGDATRIVDLKTGDPQYAGDPETHAQLAMYQLAAAEGAFPGVEHADGADLVFVGGSAKGHAVREQLPIDVAEQRARLADVVDTMRASTFVAVENDMCGRCPVRRSCPIQPEGRQVSES
ncbi:UrvD/REP family ATP-dependent DNA helicase [Demequina sp. NBRC 110056]|uniref:UrvD/REP family ATP-dependent DNA helicase n=1 Tax=Demequina sp. NBRC 110056 TaxID=1570345 RepID=UPI000A04E5E2|nr:UrvD/REP family ATP-dependent DNA helicase [Demequina sp. NBRC 110056]